MRQMAMVGSGCSACHSFTGPCPHEAPPWAGCSQHQVTILLRALHSAPSKKLNLLPRPYDLACLPPQLHLPSAPPSLPQSPWPPLLPHMKLPSQGFVPAVPSAIITSPTEAQCLSPAGLRQAASLLVSLAGGAAPSLCLSWASFVFTSLWDKLIYISL